LEYGDQPGGSRGLLVNCVLTNTMGMVVPGHCQESLNDEKSVGPLAVGRSRRVDCAGHVVQVLLEEFL